MSASLHADGIGGAVYDRETEQLIPLLDEDSSEISDSRNIAGGGDVGELLTILAYGENIQFTDNGELILLSGGGRDMAVDKKMLRVRFEDGKAVYLPLETAGLTPCAPAVVGSGNPVYFAGSKEIEGKIDDWNALYPMQRQLYRYDGKSVAQLTEDDGFTCEYPVLTRDEKRLVFGRIAEDGSMSLWMIGGDGSEARKLTDLKENVLVETEGLATTPGAELDHGWNGPDYSRYPASYDDYYGRGGWGDMVVVY